MGSARRGRDLGQLSGVLGEYESALRRNEAEVFHFEVKSFVEFEECEDEGACYAFEIDEERVVFVVGQRFCHEAKFPSHDFSLVYILGEHGNRQRWSSRSEGPKYPRRGGCLPPSS